MHTFSVSVHLVSIVHWWNGDQKIVICSNLIALLGGLPAAGSTPVPATPVDAESTAMPRAPVCVC